VQGLGGTHQSAHGAVQSMPVVPPELGVGTLERGVTVGLRLLDTVMPSISGCSQFHASMSLRSKAMGIHRDHGVRAIAVRDAYPFRWFFLDWLC